MVFLELRRDSRVTTGNSGCLLCFNKAEIDVFLELSCFFNDPANVGNLIADVQQYVNRELPDIQAGFRKGRRTRAQGPLNIYY